MLRFQLLWIIVAVTLWNTSCGRRPLGEQGPDANVTIEGGVIDKVDACDGSCGCPARAPDPDTSCPSPGLECMYPRFFCWSGRASCSENGTWRYDYPSLGACPAELPLTPSLCEGRGTCAYTVDTGCGPALAEISCACLDASWLWQPMMTPSLCSCSALTSRALCSLYPRDCIWSLASGGCVPMQS